MVDIENNPNNVPIPSLKGKKVWVTGHRGMLGSAMVRNLENEGAEILVATRQELDLTNKAAVLDWMKVQQPEYVFHIAAKVGGIHANSVLPADFLLDNLMIEMSVIDGAYRTGVKKLVFVASNCTFPTKTQQPILENALFTGILDENIRSYAVSKIAGIEMCSAFRRQHKCHFLSVIPPNLYGPGDNYHPEHCHVVAGIMRRMHEAKVNGTSEVIVWGDGTPRRELLFVEDLAEAMKVVMKSKNYHDIYNIGCGYDLAIAEIANIIRDVVGYEGKIVYDPLKPNGTMRKLLDSTRINSLGWRQKVSEKEGLKIAYKDFLNRMNSKSDK